MAFEQDARPPAPDPELRRSSDLEPGHRKRNRGWSGIAFAVLFFMGLLPLGELLGSFGDSDATFVAYFAKDSNRIGTVLGGALLGLAGLAFFWFLANLRQSVDTGGPPSQVISTAGTAFVVLLMTGAAALVTVPYARTFGGAYGEEGMLVGNEALLPQLGYVLLAVMAMWAMAALIVAVTLAARSAGVFPRWLVRLGLIAAGFVFLLGPSVMGILGVPVWALAVSVHWLRTGTPETEAQVP